MPSASDPSDPSDPSRCHLADAFKDMYLSSLIVSF